MKVEQGEATDLFAAMAAKEVDQPVRSRDIGPNGVRAPAPIMCEMPRPASRQGPRRMTFLI